MIAVLRPGTTDAQMEHLIRWLKSQNVEVHVSHGTDYSVLGLIGAPTRIATALLQSLDNVESGKRVTEPFKQASRKFHPRDTIVDVGGVRVGGGYFALMAGPCSVETPEQIIGVAKAVKEAGANILRGGAFKPRTSPYDFQGLKDEGIRLLIEARKETGLPIVTELMSSRHLDLFADVDMIQIGARNMQNFDLLKELGHCGKPILLKRGLANTMKEWLMSAEYIMASGNEQVVLCERGIRTFETYSRNTLDLSAVPIMQELSHLPIVVDPSHATGKASLVPSMAVAAAASGADGIMIEVHNDPAHAWCDGPQSLTPDKFAQVAKKIFAVREVL